MRLLYNFRKFSHKKSPIKEIILLLALFFFGNVLKAQIYQDNFGLTGAGFAYPYVPSAVVPTGNYTADTHLSNISWANSTGSWTTFNGSTGQAICLSNSSGTPTITITFDVAPGFSANISSFNFWRQRSGTGAQNWSMNINGNLAGSGTVPTSGATFPAITVSNANNLIGTVTIVISLSGASGTGTFRIDDFTLNGTVGPATTLASTTPAVFTAQCINVLSLANGFSLSGANLTAGNLTVTSSLPAVFTISPDNVTFSASFNIMQAGGTYPATTLYVKFLPTAAITYNGTISISGGGANPITVPVSGNGVNTKPSITNGSVSNITTSSADVAATITAAGCTAVTAYGVIYSTTAGFDPTITGTSVPGGVLSGGNFTSNLTGLGPAGQTIYFYTYATNAGGTSYGSAGSFTLLNTIPTLSVPLSGAGSLAPFGNVCINTATIGSFNLAGSVLNGSNIIIGPLTNYSFSTSLAGVYSATLTLVNGGAGYSYSGGILSATIYVKLIAPSVTTYNGNIGISGGGAAAINVATTGAGINDAPTVNTSAAIFITTSTATLPGVIINPGCGVISGYGIEYSTAPFAPGAGIQVPGSNLAGGNFSVNLSSLLPGTPYYFYAYATNAGGTSYGSSATFTTFSIATKLVIIPGSVNPAMPTALAPFSVTVQAQDNLGNPADVTVDTDIQFAQFAGLNVFTFPNGNAPAATIPAGINTIIITDLSYDTPEPNVGITASTSAGMSLTTSGPIIFTVVAYVGPTTFIWGSTGSGAWFANPEHWVDPSLTTTLVPPGASSGVNNHLALFTSNASLTTTGQCSFNMTAAGGTNYSVGGISIDQTYSTFHTGNTVSLGNSSPTVSGTLSLYGTNVSNLGGIAGNNFTSLLLGNYMSNATTKTFQVVNAISGGQTLILNLASAGAIVAGPLNIININTVLTGTQALQFTGGGTLIFTPIGVASIDSFSGPITVTKGMLVAGNAGAFSPISPNLITLGSTAAATGILRLNGNSVTIGGLSSTGVTGTAIADNGNASATLTVSNSANCTFNGGLKDGSAGSLSLIKAGTASLTLTGTSNLTGSTTINNGRLILKKAGGATYPSASSITVNGPGILQISTDQIIKDLTLAGGGTLIVDPLVTLTITGNYNATSCSVNNLGTIKLQGAALQTFPGTAAVISNMNNLTINNAFGVNLNNSLNVGGTLTLSTGTFTVGVYTLTINNPILGTPNNLSANNTSSMVIAGVAAGVNIPSSVLQLKNLTVSNTVGSTLQGPLNVSTSLFISAGTLKDNQFVLNGTANVTMTGGALDLEQNTALLPGLTGVYVLTAGTVIFDGVGTTTDAQIVRPVNYFNLTSAATGWRVLSPTGIIGVSNIFTPNSPANFYTITNSTVDYNKTSAQSIAGFGYYNMTVSGAGAGVINKTLSGHISILGTLSLTTNTKMALDIYNDTLKSSATLTANVAAINTTNSFTYNTGRFIVERYINTGVAPGQHAKTWQFLSVPVKDTQSVYTSWQESNLPLANGTPGYGTTISSEKTGAVGRGFDFYTPAGPSMKVYNSSLVKWDGVDDGATNTNSLLITNQKGYMLFVRGDRSVQNSATLATNTTLRTKGKLYAPGSEAPTPITVTATKFESAGNPYASVLDFTDVRTHSTSLDNYYYVWDPLLPGTNSLGYGGYQLLSNANSWIPMPGGTTNYPGTPCTTIQSGQAFFVHSNAGGSVSFAESNKVPGSGMVYRPSLIGDRQFLRVWLQGLSGASADGNVVAFDPAFSNVVDADDAIKLSNGTENFSIKSHDKILALEARSPVMDNDTVFYNIANLNVQSYRLKFAPENLYAPGLTAYFVDRFKGTTTLLSLTDDSSLVDFDITADPASKAEDRFYIVFKLTGPVPVSFINLSATRTSDKNIEVDWKVDNETATDHYNIERGGDGRSFTGIGNMIPTGNNGGSSSYTYVDIKSLKGDNYYRIASVSVSGTVHHSAIVKVADIKTAPAISIYPNPVVDRTVNITFINQPTGDYRLQLSNKIGQVVYNGSAAVNTNNTIKSFTLGSEITAGIYQLSISSGSNRSTLQVIVK